MVLVAAVAQRSLVSPNRPTDPSRSFSMHTHTPLSPTPRLEQITSGHLSPFNDGQGAF